MATSAQHGLYYIPEVTYGTCPATPSFVAVRHTGTTLGLSKSTHVSEELRPDRNISDFRHGTRQTAGDISMELSYTSFDTLLEAALCGTWTTNVLKNGTTRRSFSMLRQFADLQSSDKPFHLFTGMEIGGFKLTVPTDGIVKGSFTVLGQDTTLSTAGVASQTLGTLGTTQTLGSLTGSITEGGSTLGIVTEVTLSVDNGMAPRFAIGSVGKTIGLATIGRCTITGQITAYFANSTLLEKFINETASALIFTLVDTPTVGHTTGNSLAFTLPNIKYTGGQPDTKGQGEIMLSMPFQAIYDSSSTATMSITRTAGAA